MTAKLRVLVDTVFKRSVQQSLVLSVEAKVSVQQGQEFEVACYRVAEQAHIQLWFDQAPFADHPNAVQWFVFRGHVEWIDLDEPRSRHAPAPDAELDGAN